MPHSSQRSAHAHAKRGVWRATWIHGPHPVVVAFTSGGQKVAEVVLLPGVDRALVRQQLEDLLEACDPQPKLALLELDEEAAINERMARRSTALALMKVARRLG